MSYLLIVWLLLFLWQLTRFLPFRHGFDISVFTWELLSLSMLICSTICLFNISLGTSRSFVHCQLRTYTAPRLYIMQSSAPCWQRHVFAVGLPTRDPVVSDEELWDFPHLSCSPVKVYCALAQYSPTVYAIMNLSLVFIVASAIDPVGVLTVFSRLACSSRCYLSVTYHRRSTTKFPHLGPNLLPTREFHGRMLPHPSLACWSMPRYLSISPLPVEAPVFIGSHTDSHRFKVAYSFCFVTTCQLLLLTFYMVYQPIYDMMLVFL